jgi:hypothetical protein
MANIFHFFYITQDTTSKKLNLYYYFSTFTVILSINQYLRQFEFKPKNQISQLYESIGYSSKKTKKLPFFHLGEGIVNG